MPLGSRLDALTRWTIREGALPRLDPLTRPFRLEALRALVRDQDSVPLTGGGRRALAWLRLELDGIADSAAVVAEVGAAVYRNGRRDTFREGGGSGNGAMGGIWASLSRGPLVVVLNPAFENRLKDDPEFTGKMDRFVAGRLQTGYVALTAPMGDLGYGRMARQWGPELFDGLQLSPSAYATEQLWGALRVWRLELSTIAQRLDDQRIDSVSLDTPISRWFLAHRLTIAVGRRLWLALTETGVYGGPGRGFEPAFHAPMNPALLSEFNESRQVNLLWGAELHARIGSRLTVQAQGMIDDIQVDDSAGSTDQRPWSGGFSLMGAAALPGVPVHLSLGYTQVRSLTYRNSFAAYEVYGVRGVGIARTFSDYDQVLLRLEARPVARAVVGLDASYLRQGSGDFRLPFPPDSVLARPGQGFLVAPVGRAAAFRLWATLELPRGLMIRGQLGSNGSVSGLTQTIASLVITARFDVLRGGFGSPWPAVE